MKLCSIIRQFATICFVLGTIVFLVGCSPSVSQISKILYGVPLGASRDEVRKAIVEAFHKKYPDDQYKYFNKYSHPIPVTKQMLNADANMISFLKKNGRYVRVYPVDLYEKMPSDALGEGVVVAEASEGNWSVTVFYDSHMNYTGFFGYTSGNDSDK